MIKRRAGIGVVIGLLSAVLFASVALADTALEDGEYTLTVPGIGDFVFDVTGNGTGVDASMAPEGYEPPDDDDDKAAWKLMSVEVEAQTDKVESAFTWVEGEAVLSLPGGGSITVTKPDTSGAFTVTGSGGWVALGESTGRDWYVANNNADLLLADKFFKVEATADGVEIKAVDGLDAGFVNELEEEEEDVEIEEVEAEDPDDIVGDD